MALGQTAAEEVIVCSANSSLTYSLTCKPENVTDQNPAAAVPGKSELNTRSKWV